MVNLLSNALKYGAGNPIAVELTAAEEEVALSVTEHGIGISSDDLPRIFERLERAASTLHFSGLGLGLYITRHVAEAHGGRIHVTSAPGQGSTFRISLPKVRPQVSA